ncbi:MAG: hypothetical protein UV80_C0006G0008 [Candidatus Peregrinibacteria bacterium GW2011_GWF2_43_17]|nr:MAG: hypothetical protein UV80_C0006G0008 [Candidatus Peregrinibacteria bacterium GW2011_GWF2_43_17]KKT18711.1 MAG: hypothetical protein UW03_C0033G0008 [Candidatus Peregrinibacteria bacterium GW2011_GWA2_43_8]HAU40400.1 hypothetical protein [Candidatus Peregrinibacteria bacterium]
MFKLLKKLIRYTFLVAVTVLILGWYFVVGPHGDLEGKDFNTGENGIWIQHAWVGNEQDPQAVYDLALKLQKYDIKYIYIHTGPFDTDGTIPEERYKFAKEFVQFLKEKNPDLIPLAWVGQVRSELEIESEEIRANIVETCEKLIIETGFAGLHYDIEPIPHDDEYFLTLLEETREAIGENVVISIATDEWQPSMISDVVGMILDEDIKSYWETTYFKDVAGIADQIAVMTYDTSLTDPEHYEWFVEQQVIYLTQILAGYDTELLIGIPTYEDDKESFDPLVENMETGLNGIITGLNNKRTIADVFTGVAIYAEWETSESEWNIYEKLWQGL